MEKALKESVFVLVFGMVINIVLIINHIYFLSGFSGGMCILFFAGWYFHVRKLSLQKKDSFLYSTKCLYTITIGYTIICLILLVNQKIDVINSVGQMDRSMFCILFLASLWFELLVRIKISAGRS